MVSALSARLLSGYSSSCNSSDGSNKTNATAGAASAAASATKPDYASSTGYIADMEQLPATSSGAPPPVFIDMYSRHLKRDSASNDERVKKSRKIQEMNYLATTAKADIVRGEKHVPVVRTQCPRTLASMAGVDMSKVQLMTSNKLQSPFLAPELGGAPVISPMLKDVCCGGINDMIQSCSGFYQIPAQPEETKINSTDDTESSTSSVTDTESDECNEVSTEGEDAFGNKNDASLISMGEALAISRQPRLVTLAFAPFTVVHVNAAYTRMTGLSSIKVLGRPFQELLDDESLIANLRPSPDTFPLTNIHQQVLKAKSVSDKPGQLECKVVVSPVGPELHNVTHYVLGLEQISGSQGGADDLSAMPEPAPSKSLPLNVMG